MLTHIPGHTNDPHPKRPFGIHPSQPVVSSRQHFQTVLLLADATDTTAGSTGTGRETVSHCSSGRSGRLLLKWLRFKEVFSGVFEFLVSGLRYFNL